MNAEFYNLIKNSTAHTQSRIDNANYIIDNQHFLENLIELSFTVKDKVHIKACGVLEKTFDLRIDLSVPHIELICKHLEVLKNDSAIRPMARIVMNIVFDNAKNKNYLTDNQLEKFTEACFDWLIAPIRMASKVYAMYTLTEIGKTQNWIYPELKTIIEKDAGTQSAGYKAAAREVLRKMRIDD
jgi:hypothetical protein